jgi:hypothetical protein
MDDAALIENEDLWECSDEGSGGSRRRFSPVRSGDGAGASKRGFGYWRRAWRQDRRPLWFAGCTELAAVSFTRGGRQ